MPCRHRFLELQYERAATAGQPEHTDRTVLFLVDAWSLAQPDDGAATAVAAAREAPEQETAAKQAVSEAKSAAKRAAEVGCPSNQLLTGAKHGDTILPRASARCTVNSLANLRRSLELESKPKPSLTWAAGLEGGVCCS